MPIEAHLNAARAEAAGSTSTPSVPPNEIAAADLPAEKLRAEIVKLRLEASDIRRRLSHDISTHNQLKSWVTTLSAGTAIMAALWGLYSGVDRWHVQKEKEYKFQLSKEMIELTNQLSSADKTHREDAALLLASFEKDAIPILVNGLGRNHHDVDDQIVESLVLIARNGQLAAREVMGPLWREGTQRLSEQCAQHRAGDGFQSFIQGLVRVGIELKAPDLARKILADQRTRAGACELPEDHRVVVHGVIDRAATELKDL